MIRPLVLIFGFAIFFPNLALGTEAGEKRGDFIAPIAMNEVANAEVAETVPQEANQPDASKDWFSLPDYLAANVPGSFEATVGFTTDYLFRGVSQTDDGPAVQGSLTWLHDAGPYAGVWGSNVDYGGSADLEVDYYFGIARDLPGFTDAQTLSYDLSFLYTTYPADAQELKNYPEFLLNLAYDFGRFALLANTGYTWDYFGSDDEGAYVEGGARVPLPWDFVVDASIGHQWIGDETFAGLPDYITWTVGIGWAVLGFDLDLRYVDTDVSKSECFRNTCDQRALFAFSRTF